MFCGRIVRDVEKRVSDDNRPYCYFDIAVQPHSYTDKEGNMVKPKAKFFHMSASGVVASALADRGKKGAVLICTADMVMKSREVEKDGKTIVYNDAEFRIKGGSPWDIIPAGDASADRVNSAKSGVAAASQSAPMTNPEEDYGDMPADDGEEFSDEESKVLGELPF